jgi:hypothetical protein
MKLKTKQIRLSESELHYCEVLKNVYKINPSAKRSAIDLKNELTKLTQDSKYKWQ